MEDIEKRISDIKKEVAKQLQGVSSERERLLQQIESIAKGVNPEDLPDTYTAKSVRFNQEEKGKEVFAKERLQKATRFKSNIDKGNTENIREMLTALDSKQEEIVKKSKQIKNLKMRRDSIYVDTGQLDETEREIYERKINVLEEEKNKLHDELVDYIIHDIIENKHEYEKTITELEEENNEMSDFIQRLQVAMRNLKDINTALKYENKILNENNERLMHGEPIDGSPLLTGHSIRSESSIKSTMEWFHEQHVLDKFIGQGLQDRDDMSGSLSISITNSYDEEVRRDKVIEVKKGEELRKRLSEEHHVMEVTEYKMRVLKERIMREGMRKIDFLGSVDPRHRSNITSTESEDSW